jgi:hypothetical protein
MATTSTATDVSDRIASCSANQYVLLAAGSFNIGGFEITRSNVVLRGAGPDQTFVTFTGSDGCQGVPTHICVKGGFGYWDEPPPAGNISTWTAGFTQGTTTITVGTPSRFAVNEYIYLDQINEDTHALYAPFIWCHTGDIYTSGVCDAGDTSADRQTGQVVKVTAINGSNLTIFPGLYYTRWNIAQSPRAWTNDQPSQHVKRVGIEDLTLAHSAPSSDVWGLVQFNNSAEVWVKNVRANVCPNSCISIFYSAKITIQDSYFFHNRAADSTNYGVDCTMSSDLYVVNNIFQQVVAELQGNMCVGAIYAYNYAVNHPWQESVPGQQTNEIGGIFPGHAAGAMFVLLEGNTTNHTVHDFSHGDSCCVTAFRNRLIGRETSNFPNTQFTLPVIIKGYSGRWMNYVGNVLGTDGYHTNYESSTGGPQGVGVLGDSDHTIFQAGFTGAGENNDTVGYDTTTLTSLLRWGNYDYATNTARFNSDEIPSDNAVPGSQTLPSSFYLTAKPSWFGSTAWPGIGPDISGGIDPAGHAKRNPAELCYLNVMNGPADGGNYESPSVLTFNANRC